MRCQQTKAYWELEFCTWLELEMIVKRPIFKVQLTVRYRFKTWTKIIRGRRPSIQAEPDDLSDTYKCRNIIKRLNLAIWGKQ